jgi:hypothetical protein
VLSSHLVFGSPGSVGAPKKWASLAPTNDENKRSCSEYDRVVYRCNNEHEARWLGKQGKCVALLITDDTEYLGAVEDSD